MSRMHGHTSSPDQNALGQAVGSATTFGLLISPPPQVYLKRVQSVGIVSQRVGNTAASAVFDYAALLAERRRLGRTTATIVAKHSNHSESHRVTCVYSFCVCSVVYVILICDHQHTTGQLSPMLFVP